MYSTSRPAADNRWLVVSARQANIGTHTAAEHSTHLARASSPAQPSANREERKNGAAHVHAHREVYPTCEFATVSDLCRREHACNLNHTVFLSHINVLPPYGWLLLSCAPPCRWGVLFGCLGACKAMRSGIVRERNPDYARFVWRSWARTRRGFFET